MPEPILSPCVKICELDPTTSVCRGCKRTLDEIARWGIMSPAERARIMADLPGRAPFQGTPSPQSGRG